MSRTLTISAISIRGGASRMSMPGRVAPQDVLEVALADPVGRQVEDRGGVRRHPQERAQVAELEAAVNEGGPRPGLAEGHREVEGDRWSSPPRPSAR